MLVTLIGKNSINKLILPREVTGNYWLYDKNYEQKRLINIESVDNNWQIKSTSRCRIINSKNIIMNDDSIRFARNGQEILEKIILKNYSFYYVTIGNSPEVYILYCSPVYVDNYTHLHIENTSTIFIGRDRKNQHHRNFSERKQQRCQYCHCQPAKPVSSFFSASHEKQYRKKRQRRQQSNPSQGISIIKKEKYALSAAFLYKRNQQNQHCQK